MAVRTFGWVQEAYKIENLKNVVSVFVPDSNVNRLLREDKLVRLVSKEDGREEFIRELEADPVVVPYSHLKGKGIPKGYTRSNSPCTGIIQAVLPGQRKEYQSDWPADSFLRWAVSIGFLNYDRTHDTCSITELGRAYAGAEAGSGEEEEALTTAFLSYPPVCRILSLLVAKEHLTKFEIGARLGFIGEAGFTSIPQHIILQGLSETAESERARLLQDTEGTSDKYVRTICSWLKQMGWVDQVAKMAVEEAGSRRYEGTIPQSYRLTLKGRTVFKYIAGVSKFARIPKRVMWDMLATKAADRDYLRNRRTRIIQYLLKDYRSADQVKAQLASFGMEETAQTIEDDIRGFENIGLNIKRSGKKYKIMDEIIGLEIPADDAGRIFVKSDLALVKDRVRERLVHVSHEYLLLIDLGFDGTSDRDYEIQTAELLTRELDFAGGRLGDTRKPDVCISYGKDGLIIDNKAYGKGYPLPIKQADEMYRYLEENKERNEKINPNRWWEVFGPDVTEYHFAFVSGSFTGGFKDRLENIHMRSGLSGGAVNSVTLLLLAEELKAGRLAYPDFFRLFDCNDEIIFPENAI